MKWRSDVPAYLPDQTANSGSLEVANNVYPRTDGYGPISGLAPFSAALGAAFKGGGSFIATDGTSTLLVGTETGLLKYSGATWTVLLSAMSVPLAWRFAQFGNFVVAVNGVQTKVVNLVTGVASTLATAPAGVAVGVVQNYVVILQTTADLLGVFTSGTNDHTNWNFVSSTATSQPMLEGNELMGFAGGEFGIILQRNRIMRMTPTGDVTIPFTYDAVSTNTGCAAKGSVAQHGNKVFFLSDSGFKCIVAGQEPIMNIGSEQVDRTFISQTPRDDWEKITVAIDPQSKVVIWAFPGNPGTLWIYNWELERWTTATMALEGVFSGFTSSVSMETLAITYPNLDALTISLDDPRWAGGNPRLYGVAGGFVGTFFGATLEATIEASFREFNPGVTTRLWSVRPVTDAVAGLTVRLDCRARLGDTPTYKTATGPRTTGVIPVRANARHIAWQLTYAAGTNWSYLQGVEFEGEPGGSR